MAAQSTFLRNKLLDFLDGTAYSAPATVYIGLFITPVNADGTGTEVSGGGYARQSLTFSAATGGSITTSADVTWSPLDSAGANTVFGWGIFDAASGGNLLFYGLFSTPLSVPANGSITLSAGAVTISRPSSSAMTDYLANAWLDKVLRAQTFAAPAAVYLGLFTTAPDSDGTGGTEVSGGGYARKAQNFSRTLDEIADGEAETWAPLSTAAAHDVVAHGWWDASSGGNLLAWRGTYADGTTTLAVPQSDNVVVAASALQWKAR